MEKPDRNQIPVSPLPGNVRPESKGHQPADEQLLDAQPDLMRGLALLGLGIALEGADRVTGQVRQWSSSTTADGDGASDWPDTSELRYALIGLLFEAETQMRRRLWAIGHARSRLRMRLARATAPIISRLVPIEVALTGIEMMEMLGDYGSWRFHRLMRRGRIEETQARVFARHAIEDWVDEGLAYFARNPAVRELILQQGGEFAASALDEIRSNSASVDSWFEEMTRRVFRRPGQRVPAPAVEQVPAKEQAPTPRVAIGRSGA
ncbi:MAG TPA: hypothetical protein VGP82_17125 [Ktedonobacterales bacterium]|jgi:hypothetical protein|nr:hypothetical protein [Ktedonobacterales bacterium]